MEQIQLGDITVDVIRSKRKTVSIHVEGDGSVSVRIPKWYSIDLARDFVRKREGWIRSHVAPRLERREAADMTPFTEEDIRAMANLARKVIPERVEYYARFVGVGYNRVTIKCQKSKWGSCSSKGNLNFNCLLMMVPGEVMDYVIVHELCHIRQMNHSRQFWDEVARVMPDYKERRKWLKENGGLLIARMVAGKE